MVSILFSLLYFLSAIEVPFGTIESAFNNQDAQKIAALGKDKMLVQIESKEGVYTQNQVSQLLKDFFVKHPNGEFKYTFKSKENTESAICTGNYQSKNEIFRTTLKWKKINSEFKLESLILDK